jgi:hypothetical protein
MAEFMNLVYLSLLPVLTNRIDWFTITRPHVLIAYCTPRQLHYTTQQSHHIILFRCPAMYFLPNRHNFPIFLSIRTDFTDEPLNESVDICPQSMLLHTGHE